MSNIESCWLDHEEFDAVCKMVAELGYGEAPPEVFQAYLNAACFAKGGTVVGWYAEQRGLAERS